MKKELEEANSVFPFLFSRAWRELKEEKATAAAEPPPAPPEAEPEVVYPLDRELRAHVIEIERLVRDLREGVERLRAEGKADDILVQTCRKLVTRALEALSDPEAPGFTTKRLEMTRNSLMTTWRQVNSRLKA